MNTQNDMSAVVEELERLIHIEAQKRVKDINDIKEKYEYLVYMLKDLISNAKDFKESLVDTELTFSNIEAEGYLRFALDVEAIMDQEE